MTKSITIRIMVKGIMLLKISCVGASAIPLMMNKLIPTGGVQMAICMAIMNMIAK